MISFPSLCYVKVKKLQLYIINIERQRVAILSVSLISQDSPKLSGKEANMPTNGIRIPGPKVRLLTDEVENRISKLRSTLSGNDLYAFDTYVKNVVSQALVVAKEKVSGHYDIHRMVPGYQSLVAEDYGKQLRNVVTPIVASKLPLTG